MDRLISARALMVSAAMLMLPLQGAFAGGNQWRAVSAMPAPAIRGVVAPSLGAQDRRFRPVRVDRAPVQVRAPAPVQAQPVWVQQQPVMMRVQAFPVQGVRPVQAVQPMHYPAPVAMRPVQPVRAPQPVAAAEPPAFARQYAWRPVNPPAGARSVMPAPPTQGNALPRSAWQQPVQAGHWRPVTPMQPRQPAVGQWRPSQVAAAPQPQPAPTMLPRQFPQQQAMPYVRMPIAPMPMMPYPAQPYAGVPYPQAYMPMHQAVPQPLPMPIPVPGQAMNWQPYYPPYPGLQPMPQVVPDAQAGYYAGTAAGY